MFTTPENKYRRDIDGLRAIAILGVVLFHAFPKLLSGGFVGVDIFFVISGYLISGLIWKNIAAETFTFKNFYQRRILRLFPALSLVLLSCVILGAFLMQADEFELLGKDIVAAVGFVSNFKLLYGINYFSSDRDLNPLAHLWSLGIEEQFYIFWPFLLWTTRKLKKQIIFILLFIGGISFLLNLAASESFKDQAFYSPLTRVWELIVGSALAFLNFRPIELNQKYEKFHYFNDIKSLVGLCFIFYSFYNFNGKMIFPGTAVLIPTFGALLLIAAPGSFINRVVLSNPLLVWIGLISYPLYLWHQVLFSFAKILGRLSEHSRWVSSGLTLTAFALAAMTFYFVEKPLRYNSKATKYLLVFFAAIGLAGGVIIKGNGFHSRYSVLANERNERYYKMFGEGYKYCDNPFDVEEVICLIPEPPKKPKIAIIGDSHGAQLFNGFHENSDPNFNQFVMYAKPKCAPKIFGEQSIECKKMMQQAFERIEQQDSIEIVVFAGFPFVMASFDDSLRIEAVKDFMSTFDYLLKIKKKIIFVEDGPQFSFAPEDCAPTSLALRSLLKYTPQVCLSHSTREYKSRPQYEIFVKSLKEKYKDDSRVFFYDGFSYLCPDGCPLFRDGKLMYSDTHHLSKYASRWLVEDLIKHYKNR